MHWVKHDVYHQRYEAGREQLSLWLPTPDAFGIWRQGEILPVSWDSCGWRWVHITWSFSLKEGPPWHGNYKDPTNYGFWKPPCLRPKNQNLGSPSSCGLWGPCNIWLLQNLGAGVGCVQFRLAIEVPTGTYCSKS